MAEKNGNNVPTAQALIDAKAIYTVKDFVNTVTKKDEVPMVWIQWECTDRSLPRRAIQLTDKLMQIAASKRIDQQHLAVGFVNTQHGADTQAFLDEIVLFDPANGNVEFRIIPYKKGADEVDRAYVYHSSMGFRKPLFRGRWPDLRKWFNSFDPENPEGKVEEKTPQKGVRVAGQVALPKTVKYRKELAKEAETAE